MAAAVGEVPAQVILGPSRKAEVVRLRQASALVLREHGLSFPTIARFLQRRDHSTMIYHARQARLREARDPEYAVLLDALRAVGNRPALAPLSKGLAERFVRPAPPSEVEPEGDPEHEDGEFVREQAMMRTGSRMLAAAFDAYRCAA